MLSGAKTVGRKVTVRSDVDSDAVDSLGPAGQRRYGEVVSELGPDGARMLNRMDAETRRDVLDALSCQRSGAMATATASSSCSIPDDTRRSVIRNMVREQDDLTQSEVDDLTRTLLDSKDWTYHQRKALFELASADQNGQVLKYIARADSEELKTFTKTVDSDAMAKVTDDVQVTDIRREGDAFVIVGKEHGMSVRAVYTPDGKQFIQRLDGDAGEDFKSLDEIMNEYDVDTLDEAARKLDGNDRRSFKGDLGEDLIAKQIVAERDGWEVKTAFNTESSDTGFDVIAEDANGDLHVIEVKYKEKPDENVMKSTLDETETKGHQMEDEWVKSTIQDMRDQAETEEQRQLAKKLREEDGSEDLKKDVIVVQDGDSSGYLASSTLNKLGIDRVDVIKLGKVLNK